MGLEHLQTVYSYGGGEALYSVFSAVASFFENYGGSVFKGLAMFGLLWAGFKSAANRDHYRFYIKWFLSYMVVMIVLWQPGGGISMHIRDVITKETFNVQGLPPGLVVPAGVISGIGHGMTEAFESVFSSVNDLPYQKYGTVFGAQVASELRNFKIQDPVFRENMESYVSNCMMYDVMLGQTYDITTLKTSRDIFSLIKNKASRFRMVDYRHPKTDPSNEDEPGGGRDLITCYDAIVKLEDKFKGEHNLLGLKFPNFSRIAYNLTQGWVGSRGSKVAEPWRDQAGTMITNALGTALGFYGNTESGQQSLRQILMINAFKDKPSSYGSMRALQNQNTAWRFTGELARTVLPVMHATFECLVYGCFPIIIGFLFFTGAFRLLGSYFGILIWLQLWPLLFSILNLVISVFSRRAGLGEVLTINNITNIVDTQSSYAMAASSLGMLVPVLSYMIVRGGAGQFVHIASQLAGSSSQGVATATAEVTSGNKSYDNVSMGNMSLDNANSHKHDITLNSRMMTQSFQNPDGSIETQFIYGDKPNINQSGAGLTHSSGLLNVNLANEIQQTTQKSYQEQKQHHEQESFALERSERATKDHAVKYMASMLEAEDNREVIDFGDNGQIASSWSETSSALRKFAKDHNYSYQQAANYAINGGISGSAGVSTGSVGPNAGASLNFGGEARGSFGSENRQGLQDSVDSSKGESLNQNLETVYSFAKNRNFSEHNSQDQSLADSVSKSYEETQSKRHSLNESTDRMKALEARKSFAEALGLRQDISLYDEALKYVANQPDPVHKGYKVEGYQARQIMNDMSPEGIQTRAQLLDGFIDRYMPKDNLPKALPKVDLKKAFTDHNIEDETTAFALEKQAEFKKIKEQGPFEQRKSEAEREFEASKKRVEETRQDARMHLDKTRKSLKEDVEKEENNKGLVTKTFGIGQKNKNNNYMD